MITELYKASVSFGDKKIISDLSLEITKGEILCIIGPSGCGKTTLLNLISGHLSLREGHVKRYFEKLSYVFQEDRLLPWEKVKKNISIVNPDAHEENLKHIIRLVGLEGFEDYYPGQLSGGMRQRVSIARGFFFPAELLLMDEPLKSLDYSMRMNLLYSILKLSSSEERTLVYVTHEIDEALILADRIIVLSRNPASIAEEFRLSQPKGERDLKSSEIISVRNMIIDLLDEYHRQLC